MVLFVFEGTRPEGMLFESIDRLFLHIGDDKIKCIFHTNIYTLYQEIQKQDDLISEIDTLSVLKEWLHKKGDHTLDDYDTDDFSEIYLFFDYDPHAAASTNLSIDETNRRIGQMLDLFDNETEHGKLFISYPMSEAYRYTKQVPDEAYHTYSYPIKDCKNFKNDSASFSHYKNTNFISIERCKTDEEVSTVLDTWTKLCWQNAAKANFICTEVNQIPNKKDDICQHAIFNNQLSRYIIPKETISILSAFPLFLFDYLNTSELFG